MKEALSNFKCNMYSILLSFVVVINELCDYRFREITAKKKKCR